MGCGRAARALAERRRFPVRQPRQGRSRRYRPHVRLERDPGGLHRPFVLAGGITPDNVHDAIRATSPWAVDVASGIEVAPGVKDGEKMRRFVAEVRRADGTGPD